MVEGIPSLLRKALDWRSVLGMAREIQVTFGRRGMNSTRFKDFCTKDKAFYRMEEGLIDCGGSTGRKREAMQDVRPHDAGA